MKELSIVIPTWNEEGNILALIHRIDQAMFLHDIRYEIIVIDDHSTDHTRNSLRKVAAVLPVSVYLKRGKKGKAQSLLEGFSHARYATIAMIDGDLQYPPEVIPDMLQKIITGKADIVIANRKAQHTSLFRKISSKTFRCVFGKWLHGLDYDVQSGLKVFRKEIVERISLRPSPWAFDLEFLVRAKEANYRIDSVDIEFQKRYTGKSKVGIVQATREMAYDALKVKLTPSPVILFHPSQEFIKGKGFHYKGTEFIHHTDLSHQQSALYRFTRKQIFTLCILALVMVASFSLNWKVSLMVTLGIITIVYFIDLLFNLYLIYRSFSKSPEIRISKKMLDTISEDSWPLYSILCPLYKEWNVVPQFITAMNKLDYPKDKLQVMLLLEEDDTETIEKVKQFDLPKFFEIVIVPNSKPKTKPKACNYAITRAKGEYVVIFDAEDVPEPDQLKKAIIAFKKSGYKTACIQAKLNFYNPYQNILTRIFTAEYSLWFDLVLTGLQSIHAPIPLGGTSNHFRIKDLKKVQGWDSFNVTEDCDLGMRLVKAGFKTAIIDSTTHEEANSDLFNWFNQRSRWIKGYIQTYFVHMRSLRGFRNSLKQPHALTFQLIVGGKIVSMLINPFMWIVTIAYFVFRAKIGDFIDSLFLAPIFYMAIFALVFGNFLYMYYYFIGCAKREYDDIMKYLFLIPLYWLAMSIAAWRAVYQFLYQPHYWAKTRHGLHLSDDKSVKHAETVIDGRLVDVETAKLPLGVSV